MTTENLLQKLEEKVMLMLAEVEDLRKELRHKEEENLNLRAERDGLRAQMENNTNKVGELIELLNTVCATETQPNEQWAAA